MVTKCGQLWMCGNIKNNEKNHQKAEEAIFANTLEAPETKGKGKRKLSGNLEEEAPRGKGGKSKGKPNVNRKQ